MNFRQPLDEADQSSFIFEEGAVNYSYPIHLFLVDPFEADSPGVQIVYISEIEGKTLVAIPFSAWNRAVSKTCTASISFGEGSSGRSTGMPDAFTRGPRPRREVEGVGWFFEEVAREECSPGPRRVQVRPFFRQQRGEPDVAVQPVADRCSSGAFCLLLRRRAGRDSRRGCGAHAGRRWWIAGSSFREGWNFRAVDGRGAAGDPGAFGASSWRRGKQPGQHRPSALRKPGNQQSVPVMVPTAKMKSQSKFPLLDAGVVTAALQAGVPESNLLEMQRLLGNPKGKASKIQDMNPSVVPDPISEDEDEGLRAAQEAEGSGSGPSVDPMQQAVEKLTSIVHTLTLDKQKKSAASRIDQALDGVTSSSLDSSSGLGSGKKNAAARRTLRSIFNDHPEEVSQVVERLMYEDLNSQTLGPGQVPKGLNARAWVEFRSRIGNYKTSAHSSWSAAGVLDSLIAGDIPKARARCALLLLQLDQASIDRGNWGLASELALEPPPPFSSLATHVAPSVADGEMPFSRLLDPRWAEISLGFLKDQDDYLVRRKNVGKFNVVKKDSDAAEEPDPKKRPKPKPKAKGGGQSSQPEN